MQYKISKYAEKNIVFSLAGRQNMFLALMHKNAGQILAKWMIAFLGMQLYN